MDILDDDFDLGYTPTMMGNSRTGSMKKINKKDRKPKQATNRTTLMSKNNDFDDLLDDLLEDKSKSKNKKQSPSSLKKKDSNFDAFFDEPSSILNKTKQLSPNNRKKTTNNLGKTTLRQSMQDVISQDSLNVNFGRTQQTIINPSKVDDTFVSSRAMKPPIRKKDSSNFSGNFGIVSQNKTIPEEDYNNNSSQMKKNETQIIQPPPRLMNRRSSLEGKVDQSSSGLGLTLPIQQRQKEKSISPFKLALNSPDPISLQNIDKVKQSFKTNNNNGTFNNISMTKDELKPKKQKQSPFTGKGIDISVDQSITMMRQNSSGTNKISNEKQVEQLKKNFQRQIEMLEQNLEKQIKLNKETREKVINDSNQMIDTQRKRNSKIHEEETTRMKEMFEWQKKRMEDSYSKEIESLRHSLEYATKTSNLNMKNTATSQDNRQKQYQDYQIKLQKKSQDDRERLIEKRQMELQQREMEFNKKRRRLDDKQKEDEKRLIQIESKNKRQNLEFKKQINEEKQKIAMEMANLELDNMRKKEKLELKLKQIDGEKQAIDREKYEVKSMHLEFMAKYKVKVEQLQRQQQKIRQFEAELIKKLRIIELKSKQANISTNPNKTMASHKKQNNWVDIDNPQQHLRSASLQKNNQHSTLKLNQTKDRFHKVESHIKTNNKLSLSSKQNGKFDLDRYMMSLEQYTKLKQM